MQSPTIMLSKRLLLVLFAFPALACGPGGGCPWTKASAVQVSPATACLDVSVMGATAGASGTGAAGGCVNPDLRIANACTDTLVLDGIDGQVSVAPGETTIVEVPGQGATTYDVEASLGSEPIQLSFTTSL